MNKRVLFFMTIAAVSMIFAGCKKDSNVVKFGVEVEKATANSKLYIDDNHNPVFFREGEMINVNGDEYPVVYNDSRYEVAVAELSGNNPVYYAFYPTSLNDNAFSGTSDQPVHLSRWQPYVKAQIVDEDDNVHYVQNVQLPAAAVINGNTDKKFKFYNLCSLLEVQWTNTSDYAYDIIGIEVTVPGLALYGDGVANNIGSASTSSGITLTDVKKNRVNLDIAEGDRETVAASTSSRKYYVVLPPFSSKNVTVRIQTMRHTQQTLDDQKLRTITVNTTEAVSLPRNYIVPMHISGAPKEDNGLTGYFSIDGDAEGNDTYKVVFSRGNLQHLQPELGQGYAPSHDQGSWKFADRQYDFFGRYNVTSNAYNLTGTVDLFAWSNSEVNTFGLAVYDTWTNGSGSGSFVDWGQKSISGDPANTWFTMRADEWYYLFHLRVNNHGDDLRGRAKITGIKGHQAVAAYGDTPVEEVCGFILLPDDWTSDDVPSGLHFTPASEQSENVSAPENVYTMSEWARMEAAGAMFLPAAGWGSSYHDDDNDRSDGSDIYETYQSGQYWSSSKLKGNYAESGYVAFQYNDYTWWLMGYDGTNNISQGISSYQAGYDTQWWRLRSVRLVKPAPGYENQNRPTSAY